MQHAGSLPRCCGRGRPRSAYWVAAFVTPPQASARKRLWKRPDPLQRLPGSNLKVAVGGVTRARGWTSEKAQHVQSLPRCCGRGRPRSGGSILRRAPPTGMSYTRAGNRLSRGENYGEATLRSRSGGELPAVSAPERIRNALGACHVAAAEDGRAPLESQIRDAIRGGGPRRGRFSRREGLGRCPRASRLRRGSPPQLQGSPGRWG